MGPAKPAKKSIQKQPMREESRAGDARSTTNSFGNLIKAWRKRLAHWVSTEDIPFLLEVAAVVANRSEGLKQSASGWNVMFQFKVGHSLFVWLQVKEGRYTSGSGRVEHPDISLLIPAGQIDYVSGYPYPGELPTDSAEIFTGGVDAADAYETGIIQIKGSRENLQKFADIMEWVRHDLEIRQGLEDMANQPKKEYNPVIDDPVTRKKTHTFTISLDEAVRRLVKSFTVTEFHEGTKYEVKVENLSPNIRKLTRIRYDQSKILSNGTVQPTTTSDLYVRSFGNDQVEVIYIGTRDTWGLWDQIQISNAIEPGSVRPWPPF